MFYGILAVWQAHENRSAMAQCLLPLLSRTASAADGLTYLKVTQV